jgi:hypothetical protein
MGQARIKKNAEIDNKGTAHYNPREFFKIEVNK